MDGERAAPTPGRTAMVLAALSVGGFWLMPFSPLVAAGAVAATRGTAGWPRRMALAGALLCSGYTLAMGFLVARMIARFGLLFG